MRLLAEALIFLAIASGAALLANALRADSLEIGRDYFPAGRIERGGAGGAPEHEFTIVDADEVEAWLEFLHGQPGYEDAHDAYLVDARKESDFARGRIPGAILVDPYRTADYLSEELLDGLRQAVTVILYCNGGDCEDSIQLAYSLVYDHQVPKESVQVYEGGWEEWTDQGRAVEPGE